jgi:hypothetical protein
VHSYFFFLSFFVLFPAPAAAVRTRMLAPRTR